MKLIYILIGILLLLVTGCVQSNTDEFMEHGFEMGTIGCYAGCDFQLDYCGEAGDIDLCRMRCNNLEVNVRRELGL